jgi:hypothetical protein
MANSYATWARREQVQLGGVKYEVRVAARGLYYCGAWVCWDCGEHELGSLEYLTADQASAKAKLDLRVHHDAVHRLPRKPK